MVAYPSLLKSEHFWTY